MSQRLTFHMKTIIEGNRLAIILAKAFVFAEGRDDLLTEIHHHLVFLAAQPRSSELWQESFPFSVHSMQFLLRFRQCGEKIEMTVEQFPRPDAPDQSCW